MNDQLRKMIHRHNELVCKVGANHSAKQGCPGMQSYAKLFFKGESSEPARDLEVQDIDHVRYRSCCVCECLKEKS